MNKIDYKIKKYLDKYNANPNKDVYTHKLVKYALKMHTINQT